MSSLLFGNGSDIVQWEPTCRKRGTIDILTTCIITLLLCAWTAVHLNVPPPGSVWKPRFRKVGWLILALVAPEFVAYTAWHQRQQALEIIRAANKAYDRPNPPSWHRSAATYIQRYLTMLQEVFVTPKQGTIRPPTPEAQKHDSYENRHTWTLSHGFYAIIGGFALHVPANLPRKKRFLPSDACGTWLLDQEAIVAKLKNKHGRNDLPNLSEAEITSKSKANGLAKTIVCIQALWFIAQCLTRLAQRIPISLLELNTFGHAVCALVIYLLWWQKPFEVDYPTMLEGESWWELCALLWMKDNQSPVTKKLNRDLRNVVEKDEGFLYGPKSEKIRLSRYPRAEADVISITFSASFQQSLASAKPSSYGNLYSDQNLRAYESDEGGNSDSEQNLRAYESEEGVCVTLAPGENLPGTIFSISNPKEDLATTLRMYLGEVGAGGRLPMLLKITQETQPSLLCVTLEAQDIARWRMASQAAEKYDRLDGHMGRRSKDWPGISKILDEMALTFGFSVAAIVYGGLHALAWFAQFHSSTEQLLWRISAAVVMGGIPAAVGLFYLALVTGDSGSDTIDNVIVFFVTLAVVLAGSILPAYILARAYLVVECFISLSHLPAGVYDVPEWSSYFPHIA